MNVQEVLERADVAWHDDPITGNRIVISKNKEQPLTKKEQQVITNMWNLRGYGPNIIFKVEGE